MNAQTMIGLRTTATWMIAALLLAIASVPLAAQPSSAPAAAPPAGTEFYVGFMQNDDEGAYPKFMGLMITSQLATTGSVEIPGFETKSFTTVPGQVTTIAIPRGFEHTVSEDTVSDGQVTIARSVHVTSRAPISVFVLNARNQTAGGFAAIPVDQWGTHYLPLALPSVLGKRSSELMILAAYDETYIRFTPSATTYRQDRGVQREIKLQRGRTYFVQALMNATGADLSGSDISSTRPIGVICGHVRTPLTSNGMIPQDPQAYAAHQAVMILPDSSWGREFVSAPLRSSGDRFRVMTSARGSMVATLHSPDGSIHRDTLRLEAGAPRDVLSIAGRPMNGPVLWQSSAPALVMQIRTGTQYGDPANSPAIAVLPSTDAFSARSAFVATTEIAGGTFNVHELSLVVRVPAGVDASSALGRIMLNGAPLAPSDHYRRVGATGYYTLSTSVLSGGNTIAAPDGLTIAGIVSGSNGTVHRDAYLWSIPSWSQPTQFDGSAPFVVTLDAQPGGIVSVVASDRSGGYFSGIGDIDVHPSSAQGWRRISFNAPLPDEDGVAVFRAIADPTGPLVVSLRDRDGNAMDTSAHTGMCFKTAVAEQPVITLQTVAGQAAEAKPLRLVANSCGDIARVTSIDVSGAAAIVVQPLPLPLSIGANLSATVASLTSDPTAPAGTYKGTLQIRVDDSTLVVRVELVVLPPAAAPDLAVSSRPMRAWPNPSSEQITLDLGAPAGSGAVLVVTDHLGRAVRRIDVSHGLSSVTWDGRTSDGARAPSGAYVIVLRDGRRTVATGAVLTR